MKKKIFKKLLAFTATAVFAVGAISSHAYYVETNKTFLGDENDEVFNLDVEGETLDEAKEAFEAEFNTISGKCSIVDASEEGLPGASAHGKIVKYEATSTAKTTILDSVQTDLGEADDMPEGAALDEVGRVAFQVDILLGSDLTRSEFRLYSNNIQRLNENGDYKAYGNSQIMKILSGTTPKRDGSTTSKAVEVVAYDTDAWYRIAELEAKQWYTFTLLFDMSADTRSGSKYSIWIDDELVAENWVPHQGSVLNTYPDATIKLIRGFKFEDLTNIDSDVYFDNFKMWKDVQVDEFLETFKNGDPSDNAIKTYDGYQSNYSVTTSEATASVEFEILSYMDLNRPAVALAAVYDNQTNTVGTVYYKPLNLIMAKTVSDKIENIALPPDYNENDYEIKLYIWDRGDIFAPVFIPELQTEG